jgi:hypothetical protein
MAKTLQKEVQVLRKHNERLKKRVEKLELALRADIKEVAAALLRGVDRLAQAQQIVVSSLENARDIIKIANE